MITEAIGSISDLLNNAINKVWPNPEDKAKSEAVIMAAAADAAVRQLEAAQAVMLAEAKSEDKWTSRARPSFLYVVYILLLAAIPMGIVHAIDAKLAADLTAGMQAWFSALPSSIVELFQWVMLGYMASRSYDKKNNLIKK